ncbi:hypothetical protein [Methanoregula formicica]|uniref:Uncharacterized protein n=1 Tax=Methanoregula formicica (strain DSM 22288 / NBRC 105244 / SMSP) TaxID=593750 RepID=L0HCZ8_METFS|nr:hypothetical protein [Methanoregula formicica]AGB02607.1 hypothetical protein Metfor_1577 [Methanoregula formicica SMSP]
MNIHKTVFVLLALLLAGMAIVPMVNAADTSDKANMVGVTVPAPESVDFSELKARHTEHSEEAFILTDPVTFLTFWNNKLEWGLSQQQIETGVKKMEAGDLKKYWDDSEKYYEINNPEEFSRDLQRGLGITSEQAAIFVKAQKEQTRLDYQNYQAPSQSALSSLQKSSMVLTASPSTQSAPSATGYLYTVLIFTDFQIPSEEGAWRDSHKEDAWYDAWMGTNQIESQADSRAGVDNSVGTYSVTVSGQNTGDNSNAWGSSGWMERAAQNLGYTDSNSDGRYTDDMARALKSYQGADSVMLMFATHDITRSYAVGPDQGYADKAAIGYWWMGSDSAVHFATQYHYEHEALHLYGALDEYEGQSYCGQASSLAVDPMQQFYTNTNNFNCSVSTTSVMRDLGQTVISLSTKRFIGWGDHDNDGTLDPFDSSP